MTALTDPAERAAHTPGPWLAEADDSSVFDSEGREVADCLTFPFAGEEAEANARLIAAAPELYEALKALIVLSDSAAWDKAFAALAKAEGRNHDRPHGPRRAG